MAVGFGASGLPLSLFIVVGDDAWKNPNSEDYLHDLDREAHLFVDQVARVANIRSEFRGYDGGHDEGLRFLADFITTDESTG